jgi:hypothetical protein
METATNLRLPWRMLREKLAPVEKDEPLSKVHYSKTLDLLDTDEIVSIQKKHSLFIFFPITK